MTKRKAMKQPIATVEFEGGEYRPWVPVAERRVNLCGVGLRNPDRVHAIIFDDGSAFDTYNGWRFGGKPDAELAAEVLRHIGAKNVSS